MGQVPYFREKIMVFLLRRERIVSLSGRVFQDGRVWRSSMIFIISEVMDAFTDYVDNGQLNNFPGGLMINCCEFGRIVYEETENNRSYTPWIRLFSGHLRRPANFKQSPYVSGRLCSD